MTTVSVILWIFYIYAMICFAALVIGAALKIIVAPYIYGNALTSFASKTLDKPKK